MSTYLAPAVVRGAALQMAVFVWKLLVLLQLKDHPLVQPDAGLDTTAYVHLAGRVLAGDIGLGPGLYDVSPFYIYFLAAALAVFDSFTAVRVIQIVLGVGLLLRLAWKWIGEHPADAAALFARKVGYVFSSAHVALPHSYPFFAYDERTVLRFYAIGPWLLVPMGHAELALAVPRTARADYLEWA